MFTLGSYNGCAREQFQQGWLGNRRQRKRVHRWVPYPLFPLLHYIFEATTTQSCTLFPSAPTGLSPRTIGNKLIFITFLLRICYIIIITMLTISIRTQPDQRVSLYIANKIKALCASVKCSVLEKREPAPPVLVGQCTCITGLRTRKKFELTK